MDEFFLDEIEKVTNRSSEGPPKADNAKKSELGASVPDYIFSNESEFLEKNMKEIPINAVPMDFTEVTPSSATETERSTRSKDAGSGRLNYTNFESATFKAQSRQDHSDSNSDANSISDMSQLVTPQKYVFKTEERTEVEDNEFTRFYENLYSTSEHGDPVVGAFILTNKEDKNEFLYRYPEDLKVEPGVTGNLKAKFNTTGYTCKRNFKEELESSVHLIPDLAFGSRKRNSLVDFVHFVLPTNSGNAFYGTSYVLQLKKEKNYESENSNQSLPDNYGGTRKGESNLINLDGEENKDVTEKQVNQVEKGQSGSGEESGSGTQKPQESNKYYVAVCLVYTVPFFGLIGSRLEYVAQLYFDSKNFQDHTTLRSFVEHINKNDKVDDWTYESLFFNLEYHFKPFSLSLSYRALLFLLKSVLTEQKIAIYSECAGRTSTCILSVLTMIPCANAFKFNSKAFGSLWFNWKKYGFPLDLFTEDNPIYPYFTENMTELVDNKRGYLVGITDLEMVRKFKNPPSLIFDLECEVIKLKSKDLLGYYSPSFYEINFFNEFDFLDDVEIDDEPYKMVIETSENIFHLVGDYLAKAPSTIINLGGKASKIYHMGKKFGQRRHKESYLRLFDVYFPGALPKFLKFSKKKSKIKKKKDKKTDEKDEKEGQGSEEKNQEGEGTGGEGEAEGDGEEELDSETYLKEEEEELGKKESEEGSKKSEPLEDLKEQWDKLMKSVTEVDEHENEKKEYNSEDEEEENEDEPAFTFTAMFNKMSKRSYNYRYLDYITALKTEIVNDRTREIEYAILTRIQPLRDFLLKMFKSVAYSGGKGRRPYHLVMDFTFDLDSMIDFNNPVDGIYILRKGKILRGSLRELSDSEDEEGGEKPPKEPNKNYMQEGDEEVSMKIPSMLATQLVEIQNNYSLDFLEYWIQTNNFKEFYKNHNLEVFNEPVFYLTNSLAKYTYPNGDFYVGELVDMLREGKGSYVSRDGSRYDGGWRRDKRYGKGTLITDHIKYNGDWVNDKKHGFGRLETHSCSYVGDFRHNRYHGNGTLIQKDGIKLKGEFRHGRFEGKGMMTFPDGSVRIGTFRNGVITGVCSVIDKEGRVFVGQLYGDLFHGKGVLKYNKQTSFEGNWIKGRRAKQGTITTKISGSVLKIEAAWEDDNMLMNDVLVTFPNGYKYNGSLRYFGTQNMDLTTLKNDPQFKKMDPYIMDEDLLKFQEDFNRLNNKLLPHGKAICKGKDGGVYNGTFFRGSRHGVASQVYPNGVIYTGQYYLGKKHGMGRVQLKSKSLEVDYFKGELVSEHGEEDKRELENTLNDEFHLFEQEFTKYKLDSLVDIMRGSNKLAQ